MPRTADKTDIPQRLTDAGYLLFTRLGYNATGIQQIADEAGCPRVVLQPFRQQGSVCGGHHPPVHRLGTRFLGAMRQRCAVLASGRCPGRDAIRLWALVRHHEQAACPGAWWATSPLKWPSPADLSRGAGRIDARMANPAGRADWPAQQQGQIRSDRSASELAAFFWDVWKGLCCA